jgi:hypothetical protein
MEKQVSKMEPTPTQSLYESYQNEANWTPEIFSQNIIDAIPSSWVVVSISADPITDDLYISRISHSHSPVFFKLPMKRQSIREGEDDGAGLEGVLEELQSILSTSDSTTSLGATLSGDDMKREDKVKWWEERTGLDVRLKELLDLISISWIGGFKV